MARINSAALVGIKILNSYLLDNHHDFILADRRGSTGVVYFIEDSTDITNMLNLGTASSYIPLMSIEKLTKENVDLLKGSDKISGLVVYKLNETEIDQYSHEDKCPNRDYAIEGTCDINWNEPGTNLLNYDFSYPVFFLTNNTELDQVRSCFSTFNNFSLESHYERSLCSLELNFFMYAVIDTPTCLRYVEYTKRISFFILLILGGQPHDLILILIKCAIQSAHIIFGPPYFLLGIHRLISEI